MMAAAAAVHIVITDEAESAVFIDEFRQYIYLPLVGYSVHRWVYY